MEQAQRGDVAGQPFVGLHLAAPGSRRGELVEDRPKVRHHSLSSAGEAGLGLSSKICPLGLVARRDLHPCLHGSASHRLEEM
jgi:hypothetical protein